MADSERLTAKQRAFVRAILTERDTRAAARAAGVPETTAYRWVKLPAIQAAIHAAEADALSAVTRGLLRLSGNAVDALDGAMSDGKAATGVKVRAADITLARLLQLRELVDLEKRVSELEAKSDNFTKTH
jgi:phage terminase small subunit